jgi:hypothetical protein
MASALSASVFRPWRASQAVTSSRPLAAVRSADRAVAPDANMAPSSTYSWTVLSVHVELRWRIKAEVYVAERMGDNGDPCGVPDSTGKGEEEALLNARRVLRGARNDDVHWMTSGGNPIRERRWRARPGWMLSKNPEMSNRRRAPARRARRHDSMLWTTHRAASTAQW